MFFLLSLSAVVTLPAEVCPADSAPVAWPAHSPAALVFSGQHLANLRMLQLLSYLSSFLPNLGLLSAPHFLSISFSQFMAFWWMFFRSVLPVADWALCPLFGLGLQRVPCPQGGESSVPPSRPTACFCVSAHLGPGAQLWADASLDVAVKVFLGE